MSITTGSGIGTGNPFQNLTPMQQELSATDQTPRQALGITKNTDDVLFTTFGQNQYGPDKRDMYKSTPSNPNLERPLNTFRVSTGLVDQEGPSFEANYQTLLKMLDEDTREYLEGELEYPQDQQEDWANALNQVLQGIAVGMTIFDNIYGSLGLESIQNGALLNGLSALNAVNSSNQNISDIASANSQYLESLGPNDPNYDKSTLVNTILKEYVETLGNIIASIKNEGVTPNSDKALTNLSNKTADFIPEAKTLLSSGNLGTLVVALTTMAFITGANGLPSASSATSISLNATFLGLQDTPIGSLSNAFASALQALALPESGAGEKDLLTGLIAATIAISAGIAFATLPEGKPTSVDSHKQELATAFILAAGIPLTIFNEAGSALGADEKGQKAISAALTALSLMVANFIWTPKNTEETYRLPPRTSEEVRTSLQVIADQITDAVHSGRLSSASEPVAAALYHASASLSDGDYGTFFSVLSTGLHQLGINWADLTGDLKNIGDATTNARTALDPANVSVPTQTINA